MIYEIIFFILVLATLYNIKVKDENSKSKMDWWSSEIDKASDFDFKTIYPKGDRNFWVGKSAYIKEEDDNGNITEKKCIIHVKTNLVMDYEGNLLGRRFNNGFIPIEDVPVYIKEWYSTCGF
jgi:photosystem II stability/assembly factor-like uncharacterized protein